jgi:hypothetical protein
VVLGDEDTFEDEDLLDTPIIDSIKNFDIVTFEIKTLADLCIAGIAFREYAGPAFIDVVEELRELNDPNRPILIAVDQVNFWDMKTVYKYQGKAISVNQLCVPYATKFLSHKKAENTRDLGKYVFCLGASSLFYPVSKKELITYVDSRSSLPLSVHVPCYSHVEFLAACKLYLNTRVVDHGVDNQQLLAYRIHVSNNPRLARRDATNFFMPIYSKMATEVFLDHVQCRDPEELDEEYLQSLAQHDFYGFSGVQEELGVPLTGGEREEDQEEVVEEGEEPDEGLDEFDNLDEDTLYTLPEASAECDLDFTKMTPKEQEDFLDFIAKDEPMDELIADELPLPERTVDAGIKRISRDDGMD